MYRDTSLILPYFQTFSPDDDQLYDFSYSHKSNACMGNAIQSSKISDYDLGGEGDLFKAPEPIMEDPEITVNPMTAAMSIGEDDLCEEEVNEEFLSNVFHEFKEILEKQEGIGEVLMVKENVDPPGSGAGEMVKSMSSDCLDSMDPVKPGFGDISTRVEFGSVYGMRRAYSDGDIKTLANGNGSHRHSSFGQSISLSDHITEDRWQKLSRYRNKKAKRNFGRKIKYACRKALADSQPRIRGRFAKTEETEIWKK